MNYNAKVIRFVPPDGIFEPTPASGCYVERGSADAPEVVDRSVPLPTGPVHDLDGDAPAALRPVQKFWQEFVFQAANPAAHVQYQYLVRALGKQGQLTVGVPGASATQEQTIPARLMRITGTWEAPYRVGAFNTLVIRAEWRLKGFLQV